MSLVGSAAEWVLPAHDENVPELRRAVHEFAEAQGADRVVLTDLALAVSEAVTNAVIHAFVDREPGSVRVCAMTGVDELTVVVTDDGRGMQPRPDSPGLGMGLPLIAQLAAHFDIREPPGGGTELRMTFTVPGVRGPGTAPEIGQLLDDVSRVASGAWPGEGVARLVDLLVPGVADACAVDVVDEAGHPRRFAGRVDGADSERQSAWLANLVPDFSAAGSATAAALTDGGVNISELTPDLIGRVTTNEEDAAAMAGTGVRWWTVAGLRGGDRLLGLLHVGKRGERPGDEWLDLIRAIAERAARGLAAAQLVAELERSRRRFEGILAVLAEAVAVVDPDGRLVYANEAAVRMFGAESAAEMVRAGPGELIAQLRLKYPDGTPVERLELPGYAAMRGEPAPPLLARGQDPVSGEERWLLIKATRLDDEQPLAVNVIEDVTPGRQAT
jgi:serine/threonine-protein kinase RsbW